MLRRSQNKLARLVQYLSDDTWGDRYQNGRRSARDRPASLSTISAKSVQQFRSRCVPNRRTDRQTDSKTNTIHYHVANKH